jgi:hypothetical protein
MCDRRPITRRRLLRLGGAVALPFVAGCDALPFDLVPDATV